MGSRSSSTNTTTDSRDILAAGAIQLTADGQGRILADFRDENAVNAAREAASGAIVANQDVSRLALRLAEQSQDGQQLVRLIVVGAFLLGTVFIVSRSRAFA